MSREIKFQLALAAVLTVLVPGLARAYPPVESGAHEVVVRVADGVFPGVTPDGGLTFLDCSSAARATADSVGLTEALRCNPIDAIAPVLAFVPRNRALADALGLTRSYVLTLPTPDAAVRCVRDLSAFPSLVESIERVQLGRVCATIPNDPHLALQWSLNNTGQTVFGYAGTPDADIDAVEAWDLETGSSAITIAIIDTGISQSHPDFQGKLVAGINYSSPVSTATDDSPTLSHGTQCAGVAAANANDATGMAGVSWGARLMPVKVVSNNGWGTDAVAAQGIAWAADHGARIASISIGFPNTSGVLQAAVSYAAGSGMLLFASTGYQPQNPILVPARLPEVIAVGATDPDDVLAWFTPTGPEIDLVAPGVNILTTTDTIDEPNGYIIQTGTSMSCPMAAGVAALVWSANPALSAAQVRAILESTADDKGPIGWDAQYGWGRINARAAVAAALAPAPCAGDTNCDGVVDFFDIDPFVEALSFPNGAGWPHPCRWLNADADGSGSVDFFDIDPLVALLGGACP